MKANTPSDANVLPVVLIVADISNYTGFMMASQESLVHGQQIVGELLQAILSEVEIPLQVKDIEGDAVFLYAVAEPGAEWEDVRQRVSDKILDFFRAFRATLVSAADASICPCAICDHLEELRLKVVVHAGQAALADVAGRTHLFGPDVALVHRLLKNSVPADEYILFTEAGFEALGHPSSSDEMITIDEAVEGLGTVRAHAHVFGDEERSAVRRAYGARSWNQRFASNMAWLAKGYFGQFPILLGRLADDRALEPLRARRRPARSLAMALALGLMGPFLLIGGAAWMAVRSLTRS